MTSTGVIPNNRAQVGERLAGAGSEVDQPEVGGLVAVTAKADQAPQGLGEGGVVVAPTFVDLERSEWWPQLRRGCRRSRIRGWPRTGH